jgi:hypothetical protein
MKQRREQVLEKLVGYRRERNTKGGEKERKTIKACGPVTRSFMNF